ncbi:MAG: hypothetical protein K8T89_04405 [Planctomycetes bacterium]|nr:hypothetical protein [Planctomycetota bacterium]
MSATIRLSSLSPARFHLVHVLRLLRFGHLENLIIANRDPIWLPTPRIVREVKLGSRAEPIPAEHDDFDLKLQWTELFTHFDAIGDGVIERLEVQNGLPFRIAFDEVVA